MSDTLARKPLRPANRVAIASGQRTDMDPQVAMAYREKWAAQGFELPPWNPPLPSKSQRVKTAAKAAVRNAANLLRRTTKDVAAERVAVCESCPSGKLRESDRRCSECSCFVDAKVMMAAEFCPLGHWDAVKKKRVGHAAVARARRESRTPTPASPAITAPPECLGNIGQRHLIYHIYPVSGNGAWQWNVNQLLQRMDLFDGVRSVAVLTQGKPHARARGTSGRGESAPLDAVPEVQRAFAGHRVDHWIERPNDPRRREVTTRQPLLDTLPKSGVTFSAHAKGATFGTSNRVIMRWAELMYRACLDDWKAVEETLRHKYMAGAFRCTQVFGSSTWHYSGAFYWFRNDPGILATGTSRRWFGTEEWPGSTVAHEHSGCLFADGVGASGALYRDGLVDRLYEEFTHG